MTKIAIVTGGGRGIGRGCALEMAARGADIALVDVIPEDLARTKAEIEALGRRRSPSRATWPTTPAPPRSSRR